MPQALAIVGAVASVFGTFKSISNQKKAAKAQERQQALQRRRSARENIRAAQIQRASAIAGAEGAGSIGGSGAAGGIGSLNSRLGGALGYSAQQSNLSGVVTRANTRAAVWSGVAGLGSQVFDAAGGLNTIRNNQAPDLTQPV